MASTLKAIGAILLTGACGIGLLLGLFACLGA